MRILPVIDLLDGQVVRGIAGNRSEYRPIVSPLVSDSRPATVARMYRERFEFEDVYVADLNAISGKLPDLAAYQAIADAGLRLWLDAGTGTWAQVAAVLAADRRVVVGLESLASLDELGAMIAAAPAESLVFSLDLKSGRPFTGSRELLNCSPLEIAILAIAVGVSQIIVLDLANVGMHQGFGTESLCREICSTSPGTKLIAGGGVRHLTDLRTMQSAGCWGALVASALHDGRLTVADCRTAQSWE